MFAVAPPGMEPLLAQELQSLGVSDCQTEDGGVSFSGGDAVLYRTNLHLRTAARVLVRKARFRATAFHELERFAKRVKWDEQLRNDSDVTLRVTCRKSRLYHSDAVAERVAGAIQKATGARVVSQEAGVVGDVEDDLDVGVDDGTTEANGRRTSPPQLIVVRIFRDTCSISACSSGEHLHKRGYRQALAKAPLRETVAAALLHFSGWTAGEPLLDPMCGSGTIAIEGALMALNVPPGLARADRHPRSYSFQQWSSFNPGVWQREVAAAQAGILDATSAPIFASDRDAGALAATRSNAARAGVEAQIQIVQQSISDLHPPAPRGFLVCNPPWGLRVGDAEHLRDLYARLGAVVRERFDGWHITILSGNLALLGELDIGVDAALSTSIAGLPVRMIRAKMQG